MYSPKISKDLIPVLYRIGQDEGRPMTKVTNDILREALQEKYGEYMEIYEMGKKIPLKPLKYKS